MMKQSRPLKNFQTLAPLSVITIFFSLFLTACTQNQPTLDPQPPSPVPQAPNDLSLLKAIDAIVHP